MAFTPFVASDQPTMANFNAKFEEAIATAKEGALAEGVKIATGSYTGTGTTSVTLTFDFPPKFLHVEGYESLSAGAYRLVWVSGASLVPIVNNNCGVNMSVSGNALTWSLYNASNASYALNASGVTYRYIAIG